MIESFDGSEETWAALHAALENDPQAVAAQASAALSSPDPDERFPAVYALGLIVDETTVGLLRPALDDPEPALRAIAAGSLIGLGEAASVPVLIEATASDEVLPFSHPPRLLWMFADDALRSYTGVDFGLDLASQDVQRATADAWQAWWAANGASLTWDGSMWVSP
ncbi:MAG TPA: HEAT repeat domain-containing protein [Anaerolineales bacterium]|nr:HEAT repeat domain-containing protein [Anaerolineales bacterium]